MADPVVHITNGVPDSGTGDITTLGAVVAALPAALGAGGGLKVDGSGTALPVSGTVAISGTVPVSVASLPSQAVTNAGTFAVQPDSSVVQASSTSGQKGVLGLAAVTTAAPSYTNGQTSALSLDTTGNLRVNVVTGGAGGGIVTQATAANLNATVVLAAGTAIAGKFGIDQTTDGTTNKVRAILHDGTTAALVKAGSTGAAAPSDPAVVVTLRDVNANGQTTMSASAPVVISSDQTWKTGMSPRGFVATFSTLTRPANATAYTAADSISDNATAGSVTALSASISDTNDDPITITDIIINSTDTGLAGKKIRAYLFNSDPTASTGVGAGDNVAYSQKKAGYIGSFMGWMETGFSDGTVGRLVPTFNETNFTQAGGFIVTKPTSGAKTLFIQYQAVEAFTPSGSSTTIIGTARGFQGRAS